MLCPNMEDRAFTDVEEGGWVHTVCALWIPGPYFNDSRHRKTVKRLESIDRQRYNLVNC